MVDDNEVDADVAPLLVLPDAPADDPEEEPEPESYWEDLEDAEWRACTSVYSLAREKYSS